MQEAWLDGNWDDAVEFFRSFFNATFKTNPNLERGIITGITRISKESIFSDLNNLEVITTTSDKYATFFGFTEEEVFTALDEAELGEEKQGVKNWYDGFIFGSVADIDEQIIFNELDRSTNAIWSLMLATGYLKAEKVERIGRLLKKQYRLRLTNTEVESMFVKMVNAWFETPDGVYNDFVKALLIDDVDSMNEFMNRIALAGFSNFDTSKNASSYDAPERFCHGFVLGLIVGLEGRFVITSNQESGFGRYDVMLTPTDKAKDNAYIIEFKVFKPKKEKDLEETVANAHSQIEEKQYEAALIAKGIEPEHIRKYGFAFQGKTVLIG